MSMKRCCVPKCNKTREDGVILHVFPNPDKEFERFNTWKNAIGGEIVSMTTRAVFDKRRVCNLHFEARYLTRSKRLSPNAIPTLRLEGFIVCSRRGVLADISNTTSNVTSSASQPAASIEQSSMMFQSNILQTTTSTGTEAKDVSLKSQPIAPSEKSEHHQPNNTTTQAATTLRGATSKQPFCSMGNKNLCDQINKIKNSKEPAVGKINKIFKLSQNPTFQNMIQKFTAAAVIFTMLQFREAGKLKMGRRFTKKEKILSLALYKQGPRAYRWLRKFFVLPSPLTLSRMITNASLKPGLNENLFLELKKKTRKMSSLDKLCILMFDEVALKPHFDYSRRTDCISGFVNTGEKVEKKIADHALVFMLRGLYKNYKQSLTYSFCASTTPTVELVRQIKSVIRKLHESGFTVVATVCDQGSTNVSAINWLINETRRSYLRLNTEFNKKVFEIDGKEIIPLYDPPHLIKGIRNNLLSKDLKFTIDKKEKLAKWDHILKLYNQNPAYQGIRLMPKLTDSHVLPSKISKMKVKCATQVFSQSVAANMGFLAELGALPVECKDTADLLLFFDNLFDSVNGSYVNAKKRSGKPLLGPVTNNSIHKKIWADSKTVLKSMKFIKNGNSSIVPSVTNWLQTIENIELLINTLSKNYKLTSVWMRHLNQDPLENFFGCIRSHGYRNTSPTCSGFEAAFASLLINNLSSIHSPGSNCEVDSCKVFKSLNKMFFQKQNSKTDSRIEVDFDDITNFNFVDYNLKSQNPKIKAQLEYVTGYVCKKLKRNIFKNCETCNQCLITKQGASDYIQSREYFTNKNYLTYPTINLIECFSSIQDVTNYIIRKKITLTNIKLYIKTMISIFVDYKFINCEQHRNDLISKLEDLSINMFLYNWCKDTNKLLNGSRSDYNPSDDVQIMSYNYFKKRNERKLNK